jgi:hypothetical protein
MKVKTANGLVRALKAEGVPWVACYPTNHVNNALGEEGVPIKMMGEERFAVAIADAFSRVTNGNQIGVCTIMSNLNAAGIQMAFGAIGQGPAHVRGLQVPGRLDVGHDEGSRLLRRGGDRAVGGHPRPQARLRRERQRSPGLPRVHLLPASRPRRLGHGPVDPRLAARRRILG